MTAARAGCEHRSARVGLIERRERSLRSLGVLDDDSAERLTERCLDGGFPAVVDRDQVEQGAQHPLDVSEPFGAGTSPGSVECELQSFDPSMTP